MKLKKLYSQVLITAQERLTTQTQIKKRAIRLKASWVTHA